MKKVILSVVAVVFMTMMVVKAEAAALSVLDSGNKQVAVGIASAEATVPLAGIKAGEVKTIKVAASITNNLAVVLSNTEIAWTLNSAGDYKASAIDISLATNLASSVSMTVAGAANLKNTTDATKTIATSYKMVNDTSVPASTSFESATAFNGAATIPVSNGVGTTHLWNRVVPVAGLPTGSYTNQFTVTFSQNI